MRRLLLPFAAIVLAAGCASPAGFRVGPVVVVELDAFSGRPNPTWTLTEAERGELERRLAGLPEANVDALPEPGLGYRGFRIRSPADGADAAGEIHVTHGLVRIGAPGARPIYRDAHGLEPWLQAQARREGHGGVLPNAQDLPRPARERMPPPPASTSTFSTEPMRRLRSTPLLAALLLAACSVSVRTPRTAAAETAEIEELSRRFSAAYVAGDAEAMAGRYTPDAVIFPGNSEALRGTEAIRRYWTPGAGERITLHRATPTEIRIDGGHACDRGAHEIAGTRSGQAWGPSHGEYVIVRRRTPQGWRMHLDMWNSRPAPSA